MDSRLLQSSILGGLVGGLASLGLYCAWSKGKGHRSTLSSTIDRLETSDPRASGIVKFQGIVYLSGQVGDISKVQPHSLLCTKGDQAFCHSRRNSAKYNFSFSSSFVH